MTRHHLMLPALLPLLLLAPTLHAEPAPGLWKESSRVMAGGMSVQSMETEVCYTDAAGAAHVQTVARRLIDSNCASESASELDSSRYTVHCGGATFGDGDAVLTEADAHSIRINIRFRNEAAGGIETEYATDARWLRPCSSGQ